MAHQRIERQRTSKVAGSLLSAGAAAAALAAGLRPVGEVMGCLVMHVGWVGYACPYLTTGGMFGGSFAGSRVIVSGDVGPHGEHRADGFGPQAAAYNQAWDGALTRMLIEAKALGASGVIGVRLTDQVLDGSNHEFMALGTAVGPVTPPLSEPAEQTGWPFCTDLDGPDVAKLTTAGWTPAGIVIGLSLAVRHDDYATLAAQRSWTNQEIIGYSELLTACKADARRQLEIRARRVGGEQVVVSSLSTRSFVREVSEGHSDHGAHTTIVGTALRRTTPGPAGALPDAARDRGLTVMPLAASRRSGAAR